MGPALHQSCACVVGLQGFGFVSTLVDPWCCATQFCCSARQCVAPTTVLGQVDIEVHVHVHTLAKQTPSWFRTGKRKQFAGRNRGFRSGPVRTCVLHSVSPHASHSKAHQYGVYRLLLHGGVASVSRTARSQVPYLWQREQFRESCGPPPPLPPAFRSFRKVAGCALRPHRWHACSSLLQDLPEDHECPQRH